ncbi:hypothetical protein LJC32_07110, partial [Oscillospiraceae bacterium OttesenSCG-928-F05]|nr:hypothetical protein [Oscillospiraceae bacterium OttesenSCG-928-F05]
MKSANKWYIAAALCFLLPFFSFGVTSIFDTDAEVSTLENRALKQRPEFSVETLFSGTYTREFEEYYSDTFPLRDFFMGVNQQLSKIYFFTPAG